MPEMSNFYEEAAGYQTMLSSSIDIHLYKDGGMQEEERLYHDYFEIFCLLDGKASYEIAGKKYALRKEDLFLLHPGIWHREEAEVHNYKRIVCRLNPWYLKRISSRKTDLTACFATAEKNGYVLTFEPLTRRRIISLFYDLLKESRGHMFGKDIMTEANVKSLLILLNRYQMLDIHEKNTDVPGEKANSSIDEVIQYINYNYTDAITLDFLCDKFYISKYYLSRSFEKATGKSIYQYILEKRLYMACQLLSFGEKPSDIYTVCGFGHYSNFYRAFKKFYKISPSQFVAEIENYDP